MQRILSDPRPDYQKRIESACLLWHERDQYWNERAYYRFRPREIDELEAATNELHERCLEAVQDVIDRRRYAEFGIPERAWPLIERSWNDDWPSVYGRFDLAYDAHRPPLMLEYNADTPTALLEASVVQWQWLEDVHPRADQFNSIHEKLIAKWKELIDYLPGGLVHFAAVEDLEDRITVTYLADTAVQAGLKTALLPIEQIGYDSALKRFVGTNNEPLQNVFKLYPWEWMANEAFFEHVVEPEAPLLNWIEPPWKMILSNKAILAVLWELFPGHPNLLEAHLDGPHAMKQFVRKPLCGREGQGVEILIGSVAAEPGRVYQQFARPVSFEERYPIVGSWVIGGEAAGIGIRESGGPVTNNTSQFVPHLF